MPARFIIIAVILIAVLAAGAVIILRQPSPPDSSSTPTALPASASLIPKTTQSQATDATKTIDAHEIPDAASKFAFSAEIPEAWQAESVSVIEAISLYDPVVAGASNLEKSQIFIRYFTANDFLTLGSVTIHSRDSLTIGGRPAVRYDIEKKPGVANFSSQPAWRNGRHIVTDIRTSSQNPSIFYVIAKRPDLDSETYESFLQSLQVN